MTFVELTKQKLEILKELAKSDLPKGDRIVFENKLKKIEDKIKDLEETTTAADIAPTMTNLLDKDECPKKRKRKQKMLRRPELNPEELEESVNFSNFFDIDKNIEEFKK